MALTKDAEYHYPLRCFALKQPPFGNYEISFWKLGDHVGIGSGNVIYRYKLRKDEIGIRFVIYSFNNKKLYIYPNLSTVISYDKLLKKRIKDFSYELKFINIINISSLPEAPESAKKLLKSLIKYNQDN